jgi:hypothetical protein
LLNPTAGHSGPLKPKDRLKLEAKRKKLMVDKGNAANMEEAREILKQLSPAYNGDGKAPKVGVHVTTQGGAMFVIIESGGGGGGAR